ncbi:MAG: hypothetical protein U1F07_15690 [Rubrivivax sp.]
MPLDGPSDVLKAARHQRLLTAGRASSTSAKWRPRWRLDAEAVGRSLEPSFASQDAAADRIAAARSHKPLQPVPDRDDPRLGCGVMISRRPAAVMPVRARPAAGGGRYE